MKWFRHELQSRESDQIFELIDIHGAQGYGVWWVILEECYKAESNGFQIRVSDVWLKRLAKNINIPRWQDLSGILDTMAAVGLINRALWINHRTISIDDLTEAYKSRRLPAHEWAPIRQEIFRRDNYTCQYCGTKSENLHCDHVIPLSRGGTNDPANLVTACARCNLSKSSKTLEEWRSES